MELKAKATSYNSRYTVIENAAYVYEHATENLHRIQRSSWSWWHSVFSFLPYVYDYHLKGYFQSWKYFQNVESILRGRHFVFQARIQDKVVNFFYDVRNALQFSSNITTIVTNASLYNAIRDIDGTINNRTYITSTPVFLNNAKYLLDVPKTLPQDAPLLFIGIHIRRGDMAYSAFVYSLGYVVAPARYVLKAMKFYINMFPKNKLVFVICTDDKQWVIDFIFSRINAYAVLSIENNPVIDFAILANCNHSIVTVGSYGWWAAYISGGLTVYYKNWPRPHSELDKMLKKSDYFPPQWVPL